MIALSSIIGFATSHMGQKVLMGVAAVGLCVWLRADAAHDARVKRDLEWKTKLETALATERTRQATANQATIQAAQVRAEDAEARLSALTETTDGLKADIDALGAICVIPDDIARRLRDIR